MFKKITLSACACVCVLNAAGYKIPEQSIDGLGFASSNIATSFGPDAAYYNPANMVFLPTDGHYFENNLAWFHIDKLKYRSKDGKKNYTSDNFDSIASTFHFVSPQFNNWRVGLSLVVPAGLGIGWSGIDPAFTGKYFKMKVIELNPSVAYKFNEHFSVAAGLRVLYTKGKVVNELYGDGERKISGDSFDFGYNLALTVKPTEQWALAATYRSKVDLTLKGKADIKYHGRGVMTAADPRLRALGGLDYLPLNLNYSGAVKATIPLPAVLALATSYKFKDLTLLFAYERTFWSKFKGYDFDYEREPLKGGAGVKLISNQYSNRVFKYTFDDPVERKYRDTNTFRFGIGYDASKKIRLMAGFVYDQNAAAQPSSVGFELPDTKAYAYSAGVNYQYSDALEFGLGAVYQQRQATKAKTSMMKTPNFPSVPEHNEGEFGKTNIWITAAGVKYKF